MRRLAMTIHGESGSGKSRLIDTAPAPRLILDADIGGHSFTPSHKTMWDPWRTQPPLGTDTTLVNVENFETLRRVYDWINTGQHDFHSIGGDSITEIQKRCKEAIRGDEQMKIQYWGTLLDDMELLIRDYRNLWTHALRPVPVVVFSSATVQEAGMFRPDVQGALKRSLPYMVDVVGYLYATASQTVPGTMERRLLVSQVPGYVAKDRTDRLGHEVIDPNIATMLDHIYGPAQPATEGMVA